MRKLKLSIILLFLLGAAASWFVISKGKGTIDSALRNFSVSDTAAVTKIILVKKNDTIVLERNGSAGTWKLNKKYGVHLPYINRLLYTIHKLEIQSPVSKKKWESVVKQLIEEGVRCDIYSGDEIIKSYYVGAPSLDGMGTYMVLVDEDTHKSYETPIIAQVPGYNSYLSPHYNITLNYWKDKTVFNYNESDIKSISVEWPDTPEKNYELLLDFNNQYKIKMLSSSSLLSNIDTSAVNQYLGYYFRLYYETTDTATQFSIKPMCVITVTDKQGIKNKASFYLKKNEDAQHVLSDIRMLAQLDNSELVSVKPHVFAKLMQEAGYFILKKN